MPIYITIYKFPKVKDEDVPKCKLQSIELDAAITGMFYSWSTGEKTQKIRVNSPGIYTVVVTSPAPEGCPSTKTITVTENEIPEITAVAVTDNRVEIIVKNEELYFEYSIDDISYQDSNVFTKVPNGLQKAYVRDKNKCKTDSKSFVVLSVPKFFTPNGDGQNDTWEIKELQLNPQSNITVFDRFGKLITILNGTNYSWDGRLNGANLPADDYWYIFKIDATKPEIKGHFSLKR